MANEPVILNVYDMVRVQPNYVHFLSSFIHCFLLLAAVFVIRHPQRK